MANLGMRMDLELRLRPEPLRRDNATEITPYPSTVATLTTLTSHRAEQIARSSLAMQGRSPTQNDDYHSHWQFCAIRSLPRPSLQARLAHVDLSSTFLQRRHPAT